MWGAVTAVLTLSPLSGTSHVPFFSIIASSQGGADMELNIGLFAPLGWSLRRLGWSWPRTLATATLVTVGIEWAQLFIPGRQATIGDILANTAGAMLAWRAAAPVKRIGWRIATCAAVFGALVALHVVNTRWGALRAVRADVYGAWHVTTPASPCEAWRGAYCVTVWWDGRDVPSGLRLVEAPEETLDWARVGEAPCVDSRFTTQGVPFALRAPLYRYCGILAAGDTLRLVLSPRIERRCIGNECAWVPVRASTFLRPLWPVNRYAPRRVAFAGAVVVIAGAALFIGTAAWWLPIAYLAALSGIAMIAGFSPPGWFSATAAIASWAMAAALVWFDRRAQRAL